MRKEIFWTVKDGQIGTAHVNRAGEEVDFRLGEVDYQPRNSFSDEAEAVVVMPPKGQSLESLELPISSRSEELVSETGRQKVFAVRHVAEWRGVAVSVFGDRRYEYAELSAEEKQKNVAEAEETRQRAEEARLFLKGISEEEILSHKFSRRDLGRLESGRRQVCELVKPILEEKLFAKFPKRAGLCWSNLSSRTTQLATTELREKILARAEEKRQKQKEEWLAKNIPG